MKLILFIAMALLTTGCMLRKDMTAEECAKPVTTMTEYFDRANNCPDYAPKKGGNYPVKYEVKRTGPDTFTIKKK